MTAGPSGYRAPPERDVYRPDSRTVKMYIRTPQPLCHVGHVNDCPFPFRDTPVQLDRRLWPGQCWWQFLFHAEREFVAT
jgi:hypothetical protein